VWRISDGKRGHDNQARGLLAALAETVALAQWELAAPGAPRALADWLGGRAPWGRDLPDPDLIVGAGHATHLPMLAAARARGGRTVVLMKPSLPLSLFDLCIVPEHDAVGARPNVLVTRGVLNRVRPGPARRPARGLVLVGGPSRHHGWDHDAMRACIEEVTAAEPELHWEIATSRRTPRATAARLADLGRGNVRLVRPEQVDAEWLPPRLKSARAVWVTEDSTSMVYEAVTAGAATGILPVPRRRGGRVVQAMERLLAEGLASSHGEWRKRGGLRAPPARFDEAARCAQWMRQHWL